MLSTVRTPEVSSSLSHAFDGGQAPMAGPDAARGGLPSGWWLLPSILGGALIWVYAIVSLVGWLS